MKGKNLFKLLLATSIMVTPFLGCTTKYMAPQKQGEPKRDYWEKGYSRFLEVTDPESGVITRYQDWNDASMDLDVYELIFPNGKKVTYKEGDPEWEKIKFKAELEFMGHLKVIKTDFNIDRENDSVWRINKILRAKK